MTKKSKKKPEKKPADLATQLRETVLKSPASKDLPPTLLSSPKAKPEKKVAETLISPPKAKKEQKSAPASRFSRLKSSIGLRQESSLAPSFLSTQHPKRGSFPWDPIRKVQAIILAIFLLGGGSLFLFGDSFRSTYDHTVLKLSSLFDWRTWNAEVYTQKNEEVSAADQRGNLLPKREILHEEANVQPAMVATSAPQGFDDSIPKANPEPSKKAQMKKATSKIKSSKQKIASGKAKDSQSKKATKRKMANKATKATKAKKSH